MSADHSVFSKTTQKKNCPLLEINIAIQEVLVNQSRFRDYPDSGFYWQQRARYGVQKAAPLKDRLKAIGTNGTAFESRCCTISPFFDDCLLNITAWKEHDFFIYGNGKYKTSDVYDDTLQLIISDDPRNLQLKCDSV